MPQTPIARREVDVVQHNTFSCFAGAEKAPVRSELFLRQHSRLLHTDRRVSWRIGAENCEQQFKMTIRIFELTWRQMGQIEASLDVSGQH